MLIIEGFEDCNGNHYTLQAEDNGDIILKDKKAETIMTLDQRHYNMLVRFLRAYRTMGVETEGISLTLDAFRLK